jgi:hypothetical protein
MREPLLHFVLLGAVLFAVDYFVAGRADDPHTITVDASVDQHARDVFKEARGRDPNADELYSLRRVWLDNEVLYREGLAMQLDKGDQAIRDRVIFKALSMIDASLKPPKVDEQVLRDWFAKNRAKYDQPATYNFQEAVLAGDKSEAALHAFVAGLNSGAPPSDAQAGLRVFKDRPRDSVTQTYGEEFVGALEASPAGEWRVLKSRSGMRAIRLDSVAPAVPADFEKLRGVVLQDWTDAMMAEQRSAAVRALEKKYTVKVTGEGPRRGVRDGANSGATIGTDADVNDGAGSPSGGGDTRASGSAGANAGTGARLGANAGARE